MAARVTPHISSQAHYNNFQDPCFTKVNLSLETIKKAVISGSFIEDDKVGFWDWYKKEYHRYSKEKDLPTCPLKDHGHCLTDKYLYRLFHDVGVNYFLWILIRPSVVQNGNTIPILGKTSKAIVQDVFKNDPLVFLKYSFHSFVHLMGHLPESPLIKTHFSLQKAGRIFLFLYWILIPVFLLLSFKNISLQYLAPLLTSWIFVSLHISHMMVIAIFQGIRDQYLHLTLEVAYGMMLVGLIFLFKNSHYFLLAFQRNVSSKSFLFLSIGNAATQHN